MIPSHTNSHRTKKKNIDTLPFENLRPLNYPKNPENRKSNNISLRICIQKKKTIPPLHLTPRAARKQERARKVNFPYRPRDEDTYPANWVN